MSQAILRKPEVLSRTGLSKSELYRRLNKGEFPRQISIGPRAVGWIKSEVDAYIDRMIKEGRQDQAAA